MSHISRDVFELRKSLPSNLKENQEPELLSGLCPPPVQVSWYARKLSGAANPLGDVVLHHGMGPYATLTPMTLSPNVSSIVMPVFVCAVIARKENDGKKERNKT